MHSPYPQGRNPYPRTCTGRLFRAEVFVEDRVPKWALLTSPRAGIGGGIDLSRRPQSARPSIATSRNDSPTETRANVFNVTGTQEEITLVFGQSRRSDEDRREVRLTNRIVLNPFTAKRLLLLLNGTVERHESKYGPFEFEEAVSGSPAPLVPASSPDGRGESPAAQRTELLAQNLIRPIQDLGIPYDFERSFKMSAGKVLKDRFLLTVDKNDIRGDPREQLVSICRNLKMPEEFLGLFENDLPDSNPVDFGFEANERTCVYKVYLDFLPRWKTELASGARPVEPRLMFLGFKWDALDSGAKALTKYTWHPRISFDVIRERVSDLLEHDGSEDSYDLFAELLETFESRTTPESVYYLDVAEDANPRRSFDLNAYSAGLRLEDLDSLLMKACRHYSIPVRKFRALLDQVKNKPFGHLSGGIDRDGKSFLTIYFGLQPIVSTR